MTDAGRLLPPGVTEQSVGPSRLFFLTNRMNLNVILASRLVSPLESFQKHYADLLERAPRFVPLLTAPPSAELIAAVTRERGSGAPVLIEFPESVGNGGVVSDGVVYVRAVALVDALAIHFADDRALREHRARGYSNVQPHENLLRVTPDLLSGDGMSVAVSAPAGAASVDWRRIDRIRGAVNAAIAYATTNGQLELVASLLGATPHPRRSLPTWLTWLELDDLVPCRACDVVTPDELTFRAIYDILRERDITDAWSPGRLVDDVRERVEAAALTHNDQTLVLRNLRRVKQIIDAEVEFEPFRHTASALISAKALILVLLRPDLAEQLAWPAQETGADDITRLVAAVLAGRLRGVSREKTVVRSLVLDDLMASWAVRAAAEPAAPLGNVDIVWASERTVLVFDGIEVRSTDGVPYDRREGQPDLVTQYRALPSRSKAAARLRVARKLGWPVKTVVRLPKDAEVTTDGEINVTAVEPVKLVESVDEIGFLERVATLGGEDAELGIAALKARRK